MKNSDSVKEVQSFDTVPFTYDSQKRKSPAIEELLDIIQYRDLIFQLVRRDIVARYKRSLLGIAWTMLQPLGMMIVLTIVFSQLFGGLDGYAAYLLSGLIASLCSRAVLLAHGEIKDIGPSKEVVALYRQSQ